MSTQLPRPTLSKQPCGYLNRRRVLQYGSGHNDLQLLQSANAHSFQHTTRSWILFSEKLNMFRVAAVKRNFWLHAMCACAE